MKMALEAVITVLCGVGLYVSLFMLNKSRRAERGELDEPSVVQTPAARLYGGMPNSEWGTAFYLALGVAIWFVRFPAVAIAIGAAVLFAALTSIVLAYSLLFVTKRSCPFCWTGHAINWSLVVLCAALFKLSY